MHREIPTEPSEGGRAQWVIKYWPKPGNTDRTMNTSYMIQDPTYEGVPSERCPGYNNVAAIDDWFFRQPNFTRLLSPTRVMTTTDPINVGLSRDTGGTGTRRVDEISRTGNEWAVEVTVGVPAEDMDGGMDEDITSDTDDDRPPQMPDSIDPGRRALIPPRPMSPDTVARLRRLARRSRRQSNQAESQPGNGRAR